MTAAMRAREASVGLAAEGGAAGVHDDIGTRLLEAAIRVFAEHGFEAARVSEIARRAGVTTGAIYGRWPGKSDLLLDAVDHILPEILPQRRLDQVGAAGLGPFETMSALGESVMMRDERRDVVIQALVGARGKESLRGTVGRFLREEFSQLRSIVAGAADEGLLDPELDVDTCALVCQAIGVGTHLLLTGDHDDRRLPTADEWSGLLARLISSVVPTADAMPESATVAAPLKALGHASEPAGRTPEVPERLLDAATSVFAECGFEAARVGAIARRAGLTTGAIYARWPGKREMFLAVVQHLSNRRGDFRVAGSVLSPPERLAALGANLLSCDYWHRDVMVAALIAGRSDKSLNREVSMALAEEAVEIASIVEDGRALGLVAPSVSTPAVVLFCQALGHGYHLVTADWADVPVPSVETWNAVMGRLIGSVVP